MLSLLPLHYLVTIWLLAGLELNRLPYYHLECSPNVNLVWDKWYNYNVFTTCHMHTNTCAHTDAHIDRHRCTHRRTHRHTHRDRQTHTQMCTQTHTHTDAHTHRHTYAHTYTHIRTYMHICIHSHSYTPSSRDAHGWIQSANIHTVCMHKYALNIYKETLTQTHLYTHTYIRQAVSSKSRPRN